MKKIFLIGKPNTGKSSIFNRISNLKFNLVNKIKYSTRNYFSSIIKFNDFYFRLYDTVGIENNLKKRNFFFLIKKNSSFFKKEDIFILVMDSCSRDFTKDNYIYNIIKNKSENIFFILNKIDLLNKKTNLITEEIFFLKNKKIYLISALNNTGIIDLFIDIKKKCFSSFNLFKNLKIDSTVSFIGKENTGKSTIFNNFLNFYKSFIFNEKGTTTNLVEAFIKYKNINYKLVDTAGLFSKNSNNLKNISKSCSIHQMLNSDIICLVLDDFLNITDYENFILNISKKNYKIIIIIFNKIDLINNFLYFKKKKTLLNNIPCLYFSKYDSIEYKFFTFFNLANHLINKGKKVLNKNSIKYFSNLFKNSKFIKFSKISQTNINPIEITFYRSSKIDSNLLILIKNKILKILRIQYLPLKIKFK